MPLLSVPDPLSLASAAEKLLLCNGNSEDLLCFAHFSSNPRNKYKTAHRMQGNHLQVLLTIATKYFRAACTSPGLFPSPNDTDRCHPDDSLEKASVYRYRKKGRIRENVSFCSATYKLALVEKLKKRRNML